MSAADKTKLDGMSGGGGGGTPYYTHFITLVDNQSGLNNIMLKITNDRSEPYTDIGEISKLLNNMGFADMETYFPNISGTLTGLNEDEIALFGIIAQDGSPASMGVWGHRVFDHGIASIFYLFADEGHPGLDIVNDNVIDIRYMS